MAAAITVPRRGWSMEEGTFAGWLKKDGDAVKPGELLFVLESDKAAEEIESIDGGILRIPPDAPRSGERVKVGQLLAYLVADGEALPGGNGPGQAAQAAAPPSTASVPAAGPEVRHLARTLGVELMQVKGSGPGGRITAQDVRSRASKPQPVEEPKRRQAITPRARRRARQEGIDWSRLQGSGRGGRIRERDIEKALVSRPSGRLVPHTSVRRAIAARMVAGVTEAAPVTLTTRIDAANLVSLRQQLRLAAQGEEPIAGYTDMILKLTAVALQRHPLLQGRWQEEGVFVPDRIDIALAVDTDAGLLVPVIRQADRLTLREVAIQSRELAARARMGRLTADQMTDATFTITSLGSLGIDAFTPILNLPQSAILGIGRLVREPVIHEDRVVPGHRLTLSLTFDHRVVDGAPAARFLDTLRGCLEQPAAWLIA